MFSLVGGACAVTAGPSGGIDVPDISKPGAIIYMTSWGRVYDSGFHGPASFFLVCGNSHTGGGAFMKPLFLTAF